jgi:AraC family ethanolamine operon transcriptional activator
MTVMQIVLDTSFNNLDQFIEKIQHWDLDFRMLDIGGFSGKVKQLVSRDMLISYAQFCRGLDQSGATPLGYWTFVILGKSCKGFWWRGHQITRDDLLVFPLNAELRCASYEDFEVATISLQISYLEQLADDLGLPKFPGRAREVIRLDSCFANGLRYLSGKIIGFAHHPLALAATQALAEKLVICAAQHHPAKNTLLRQRDLAVDRVVEYVRGTPVPTSELARLCRIARVSERTLQYAFKERYGIPPNVFVKRWNLNTARRLLSVASPSETTVCDIASKLGFLHPSQFATDYKRLFAELPSLTLRRDTNSV